MCFTCIEGIRECKHRSGPHLHNIHAKVSTASNLCAFISHRTLLRVFCVYLYLHIHTDLYALNIHKGVIKCAKGSCLPVLTLKSASGSKLGFIWYSCEQQDTNIAVGKREWLLVLQVWSHPTYAHHKIDLHEGLEKQVIKVFLGGPRVKFELNDSKAVDCPHRSLSTTWRTL